MDDLNNSVLIYHHESSDDEEDGSPQVVFNTDSTFGSSFYVRGDTPNLKELLSSHNLATSKYSIVVRKDDIYIHTSIQTTNQKGSDIVDQIPGALFLVRDLSEKTTDNTNNNATGKSVMTAKSLVVETSSLQKQQQQQPILKSSYYLIWCPYSTLCTFNSDLILHERSNGEIVTPDRYSHRVPPNTLSNLQLASSPTQGSIVDISNYGSSNGTNTPQIPQRNESAYALVVRTVDISHFKKQTPKLGYHYLLITMRDETTYPPLFFHDGGLVDFISEFHRQVSLKKSGKDQNIYFISAEASDASKSINQFNFDDYFEEIYKEKDGYWQILEWGSKITKGARDLLFNQSDELSVANSTTNADQQQQQKAGSENLAMSLLKAKQKIEEEKKKVPPPVIRESLKESIYENYLQEENKEVDDYFTTDLEPLRVETTVEKKIESQPPLLPPEDIGWKPRMEDPITSENWPSFFDEEGRIKDFQALREKIYYGGVDNSMRREVWKFLLGFYPHNSTSRERELILEEKKKEYFDYKSQWKTITPIQESRFALFRDRKSRIEKDVIRTDRTHPMYVDDDSEWLVLLHDVLLSYTFYNFDLSYVQGMGDYASIMLEVMKDEVESFWCFACIMETKQSNFEMNSQGMDDQLASLVALIKLLDPEFFNHLQSVDALNLYFCFRWVLVDLKREFDFDSCKNMWEKLWTGVYGDYFHIFICYAMLQKIRGEVVAHKYRFDDILKACIDLSGAIELNNIVAQAERAFLTCKKRIEKGATEDSRVLKLMNKQ